MDAQSEKFREILNLLFLVELQSYVIGILYKTLYDGQHNKKTKM